MTLLKFFLDWGKHGLGFLWVPYLAVMAILLSQVYKGMKTPYGYYNPEPPGNWIQLGKKTPFYKIKVFWGAAIVTVIAIIIHLAIQRSYR